MSASWRAVLTCTVLAAAGSAHCQLTYRVLEVVGLPGSIFVNATGILPDGRIVGSCRIGNLILPFAGTDESGYVGLTIQNGATETRAFRPNSLGDVPGSGFAMASGFTAIYWDSDLGLHLIGKPSGFSNAQCVGANDSRQFLVNGVAETTGLHRSFIWTEGTGFLQRNPLSGSDECTAESILPDGSLVGTSNRFITGSELLHRATLWTPDGVQILLPPLSGATESYAHSASTQSRIVGRSFGPVSRPTMWVDFVPRLLPMSGGTEGDALYIDASGNVLGTIDNRAVEWPLGGSAIDLNMMIDVTTPGWLLQSAFYRDSFGRMLVKGNRDARTNVYGVAIPVYELPIDVEAVTVNLGYIVQGDLFSLTRVDGDVLRIGRFFVPNVTLPPVQVTVAAHEPYPALSSIRLAVTSRVSVAGAFTQDLEMFNFQTNTWDQVDVRHDSIGRTMNSVELNSTGSVGRFRRSDGLLRARYSVRAVGFVASQSWAVDHDKVQWIIKK